MLNAFITSRNEGKMGEVYKNDKKFEIMGHVKEYPIILH